MWNNCSAVQPYQQDLRRFTTISNQWTCFDFRIASAVHMCIEGLCIVLDVGCQLRLEFTLCCVSALVASCDTLAVFIYAGCWVSFCLAYSLCFFFTNLKALCVSLSPSFICWLVRVSLYSECVCCPRSKRCGLNISASLANSLLIKC